MKIKHQLLLTHGLLVVLSLIIVLINIIAYRGMDSDASIVNQSGKLRALSYNMTQMANQINNQEDGVYNVTLSENLQKRIDEFDLTLKMLSDKKDNPSTGINHNQTIERLQKIIKRWNEEFKPSYQKIVQNESVKILCIQINSDIDSYVNEINEMVTLYAEFARGKVTKALVINGGLVLLIMIVTFYSSLSTNRRIRKPMQILMEELKELSLIDDEVSKKMKSINSNEIAKMTQYFNEMMFDPLTKTFNRRSGLTKLNKTLEYNHRGRMEISICFIDINGLKMVNDQLGHKYGDELIVSVIENVKQETRNEDFIIRMGGDEFLIIFNGINVAASEKVWERINHRNQVVNENEDRPYIISVSHGIVGYDNINKTEVELLIKNADDKMYLEKRYIKEELGIQIIKTTQHSTNRG
ncbi:MAG TPA: diguanylate cyclase [Lachnospiraceae bacterium]|nr:diguanylate cyclase [Lachnospiraceae bacterium]